MVDLYSQLSCLLNAKWKYNLPSDILLAFILEKEKPERYFISMFLILTFHVLTMTCNK